jgi:hypothetical protein
MKKLDFFLAAAAADECRRSAWVISAFSLIQEDPEKWKSDPYPYRIVQTPTGHFFVDPTNPQNLIRLEDAKPGVPVFSHKEHIQLKAGQVPNLHKDVETSYGNLLFNYTSILYAFGPDRFEFMLGRVNAGKIEEMVAPIFRDTPKEGEKRDPKLVYVDEMLRFNNSMTYLEGFSQLFVPAGSPKAMTVSPEVIKLRDKLIAENKGRLHDPAVVAKIDAALVAFDKEWLKGDEAENFLLSGKAYNIVRKKLFLQMGAEMGLDESQSVEYIPRSLNEGWDISKFPAMNNTLRAGSFNRGYQTMLGGESVKWLLRASSNMAVTVDDCGSKLGTIFEIDDKKDKWRGFHIVGNKGPIEITDDSIGEYIGKKVMLRSPMFCKLAKTDFCKICVGPNLSKNPTALSSAVSDYGSRFMLVFMAAAHAKALILQKMDFKKVII